MGCVREKPLHIRVAEALGWEHEARCEKGCGTPPPGTDTRRLGPRCSGPRQPDTYKIPRYDTDWAAGGPLVEKYGISLQMTASASGTSRWVGGYAKAWNPEDFPASYGSTALEAVCNQILALKEAGKLSE